MSLKPKTSASTQAASSAHARSAAPAPSSFRIAHLSDLHLTAKDGAARTEPKLFGQLGGMNEAFRRIVLSPKIQAADLVLVTGDVTDRGELDSWRVFWDAINAAKLRDKVLVVPGNHDVCCLGMRLPTQRAGYREADLQKAQRGLALGDQETRFPWARKVTDEIVVFGLSSNNLGNFTAASNAMGDLGYGQLSKLARLLKTHHDVPIKLVALHHSPNIPAPAVAKKRGIAAFGQLDTLGHQIPEHERRALRLLCITHGVRLVLHGHLHRHEDRYVDGVRLVGAAASTEPLDAQATRPEYPIATYTLRGSKTRIERRILHVR